MTVKRFPYTVMTLCALIAGLALSCTGAGMGPIVDLDPPVIDITTPTRFSYMPGEFAIRGTWTDNVGVTRVAISDIETGVEYGDATITGETWSLSLAITLDGEYGLRATAYDGGGNAGVDTVTVFVDQSPPFVESVSIIRHAGLAPTSLKQPGELLPLDPAKYVEMDYFQNESITIRAQITENRRISSVALKLYVYDENTGTLALDPLPLDPLNSSPNLRAPEWELTQADLAGAGLTSLTDRYCLKMAVEVFDDAQNANREDHSLGFFYWQVGADKPRIDASQTVTVQLMEAIPFQVFDDDDLGLVYAKELTIAEWTAVSGATDDAKLNSLQEQIKGGGFPLGPSLFTPGTHRQRRESFYPTAPNTPGNYKLVILAADKKTGTTPPTDSVWFGRVLDLEVEDPNQQPDFPLIQAITCSNPNGSYIAGDTLTFKIAFERKVKVIGSGAGITFSGTGLGDTVSKEALVIYPHVPAESATLSFTYTIGAGDSMTNIRIDTIDLPGSSIKDLYNQTYAGTYTVTTLGRPNLIVDARPPTITGYSPAYDGIMTGPGRKTITLTFSESVFAETGGLLQIRPYGSWYVPPVLSSDDFSALNQNTALTPADKEVLNWVDSNGSPLGDPTDAGNRKNYYTKNTHGLKISGASVVPDLATKYVLNFAMPLTGTEIEPLRAVFNKAKWKWQDIDATDSVVEINGETVTITLPDALDKGREWELRIAPNSFRDGAGNTAASLDWGTYRFWSPGTEAPVIRVNRISYTGANPLVSPYTQSLPHVDVPVRIDCETPGAVIKYIKWSSATQTPTPWTETTSVNKNIPDTSVTDLNGKFSNLLAGTGLTTYSQPFYAGDKFGTTVSETAAQASGSTDPFLRKARRDYVAAIAERAGHGLSTCNSEGIFKTVIMFRKPFSTISAVSYPVQRLRLSGDNHDLAGFPFPQVALYDLLYGKDMYRITNGGDYDYLWTSWEIVDTWSHIKSYGYYGPGGTISDVINERPEVNTGYPGYFDTSYGMLAYRYNVKFW